MENASSENPELETGTVKTSDYSPPSWWVSTFLYLAAQAAFMLFSNAVTGTRYPTYTLLLFYLNPLFWFGSSFLVLPLVWLHEISHYIVFRWAGASPTISLWRPDGPDSPPRGWCVDANAAGKRFRRGVYLTAIAAPTITVNLLGFILLSLDLSPLLRAVLIVALSGHLPGCVYDWRTMRQVLSVPASALLEDLPEGFAYHVPEA